MDVEKVIARKLKDDTGIAGYMSVPNNAPDDFFTITLTSEGGTQFIRECSLDIDIWSKDEYSRACASKLSKKIGLAIYDLDTVENIFNPKITNLYYSPDADTRRSRYVMQIECYICE